MTMSLRIFPFIAALCLLQGAHADVPNAISYQGRALTASGALMGAGTPITRTATFRIWGSASNSLTSDLLYSEQQVVTLAEGEFSVLIGQGRATVGTPLGYSETAKGPPALQVNTVFTSATCYLGVTIDDGTAAVDNEISPRQQFVSSAYALRAKSADGTPSKAVTTAMLANGAVSPSQVADGAVTSGKLASGAVTATQIANVTITSTKFATAAINSAAIADGTVTAAKIANGSITTAMITGYAPPGMAYIPGGTYQQGDIDSSQAVTTTVSPFFMDVNLVSLGLWQKVWLWARDNGYSFANQGSNSFPNHPVHTINWYDVVKWCNARSQQEGLTPVYYTDTAQTTIYTTGNVDTTNAMVKWTANGYRLPTEAEWERAARGGLIGQRYPWGNTITRELANYQSPQSWERHPLSEGVNTTPAGIFAPNGYGLYDMAGNVSQWCWDWHGTTFAGGSDPRGPASGTVRVGRGGSWYYDAGGCRVAARDINGPTSTGNRTGFRVARSSVP